MLIPVRQHLPHRKLPDIRAAVTAEMESSGLAERLKPGARVAIGVGSRGISNIATIVRAVVDYWTAHGIHPFIVPAMGSHGAGTAEGQASVLAHYGIDAETMGCPIVSSFDVVSCGRSDLGIEVHAARDAWNADAIFVVSRIKWHTSFNGRTESGVSKMLAIGLGKVTGARSVHAHARTHGMEKCVRSVAAHLLATGKVLGALGILEDAWHDTAKVSVLPAESLIAGEEELLALVKTWMARIPLPVDVLIVDEMGKNISGTGMDLKIINRGVQGQYNLWPDHVKIERIMVRDLTPLSYGNAVGIGVADVVHDRLVAKIDVTPGRLNAVVSGSLALVRTPLHCPTDRECFELVSQTVGKFDMTQVRVGWIRNTLELASMAFSDNMADEIAAHPGLEVAGPAFEMAYDADGNLEGLPCL